MTDSFGGVGCAIPHSKGPHKHSQDSSARAWAYKHQQTRDPKGLKPLDNKPTKENWKRKPLKEHKTAAQTTAQVITLVVHLCGPQVVCFGQKPFLCFGLVSMCFLQSPQAHKNYTGFWEMGRVFLLAACCLGSVAFYGRVGTLYLLKLQVGFLTNNLV